MGAPSEFRLLIEQKEQEIVSLCEHQISSLQEKVRVREQELAKATENLKKLQDDFQFNLELLDQRDTELDRYDASFAALQASVLDGESLLKEARTALAEAQAQAKQEKQRADEVEAHYEQKVVQLREQVERAQWGREEELLQQRKAFEAQRKDLMRQLAEREEELSTQRRELAAQFQDCIRKQEIEAQGSLDKVGAALFDSEQRCKKLERELEETRSREQQLIELESALRVAVEEREADLKSLLWELENTKALKDAQLDQVARQLAVSEQQRAAAEDSAQQKLAQLSSALAAAEAGAAGAVAEACEISRQQEAVHAEEMGRLQSKVEKLAGQLREAEQQKAQQEAAHKAKERAAKEAMEKQLSELRVALDRSKEEGAQASKAAEVKHKELKDALWERAAELDALQSKHQALAASESARVAEVAQYAAQLVAAAEREKELQRQLLQQRLQADQVAEERERQAGARLEALVRSLQEQRDAANHRLKEAEARIADLEHELASRLSKEPAAGQAAISPPYRQNTPKPTQLKGTPHRLGRPPLPQLVVPTPDAEGGGSLGSSLPVASPILSPGLSMPSQAPSPVPLGAWQEREGEPEVAGSNSVAMENAALRQSLAELRAQNAAMRTVVGQMRSEMELLHQGPSEGALTPPAAEHYPAPPITQHVQVPDEVASVRSEVDFLRNRLAQMATQLAPLLQAAQGPPSMPPPAETSFGAAKAGSAASQQGLQKLPGGTSATQDRVVGAGQGAEAAVQVRRLEDTVARLKEERARLIERSNALQADLNRMKAAAAVGSARLEVGPSGGSTARCTVGVKEASLVAFLDDLAEQGERTVRDLQQGKGLGLGDRGGDGPPAVQTSSQASLAVEGRAVVLEPGGGGKGETSTAGSSRRQEGVQFRSQQPEGGVAVEKPRPRRASAGDAARGGGESKQQKEEAAAKEERQQAHDILHKGTESQRARLRRAQKKKEEQAALPPKVRNYNLKDGEEEGQ